MYVTSTRPLVDTLRPFSIKTSIHHSYESITVLALVHLFIPVYINNKSVDEFAN